MLAKTTAQFSLTLYSITTSHLNVSGLHLNIRGPSVIFYPQIFLNISTVIDFQPITVIVSHMDIVSPESLKNFVALIIPAIRFKIASLNITGLFEHLDEF